MVIVLYLCYDTISKKRYNQLIYYIAISDFFSAIGGLFGNSTNGTFPCYIQSFLTNYFPLTSIFWTVVISYLLFDILQKPHLQKKKIMKIDYWVHFLCWGFPLLLTLLPLTTTDYGTFDGEDGWCFLRPRSSSPKWTFRFWLFAAFFAWVYIAITVFTIFIGYVAYIAASPSGFLQTDSIISSTIHKAINKLIWYPVIILISWFVMTIYELWGGFYPNEHSLSDPTFMYFTFTLPLFSGLLTTAAFFSGCHEARHVVQQEWIGCSFLSADHLVRKMSSLFTKSAHSEQQSSSHESAEGGGGGGMKIQQNGKSSGGSSSSSSSNTLSPLIPPPHPVMSDDEWPDTSSRHNGTKIPMATWAERSSETKRDSESAV
jgi:uncharacterized membrane protein YgcG